MKFERLLEVVGEEAVFEPAILLAGAVAADDLRRQLTRWTKAGRLVQLRRGLYALAPPYAKTKPHPFVIANRLLRPSYVSLQSALAHHRLIPEHVPVTTRVTTRRPGLKTTPLGACDYRHIVGSRFGGYRLTDLGGGQQAFIATPEKALLDLVYFEPEGHTQDYLAELRLQNLERIDLPALEAQAKRFAHSRCAGAVSRVAALAREEASAYQDVGP